MPERSWQEAYGTTFPPCFKLILFYCNLLHRPSLIIKASVKGSIYSHAHLGKTGSAAREGQEKTQNLMKSNFWGYSIVVFTLSSMPQILCVQSQMLLPLLSAWKPPNITTRLHSNNIPNKRCIIPSICCTPSIFSFPNLSTHNQHCSTYIFLTVPNRLVCRHYSNGVGGEGYLSMTALCGML